MPLWFSSGVFKSRSVAGVLAEAYELGIRRIELSSGMEFDENWQHAVNNGSEKNDQKFLIHNYFPAPKHAFVLNIGSLDPEGLEKTINFAHDALRFSQKLGAPFYSVHAAFAAALKPEHLGAPAKMAAFLRAEDIDREASYNVMIETIRKLADFAKELGLDLLIENNVISPILLEKTPINPLLLTSADEVVEFFEDIERENVGLLLDVAHVKVSAIALEFSGDKFIEKVSKFVRCVHVSDNSGQVDNNQPVTKDSWFLPHLSALKHCEIVLEAYNLEHDIILSQQEFLNNVINS